jgi:hypothetical protein
MYMITARARHWALDADMCFHRRRTDLIYKSRLYKGWLEAGMILLIIEGLCTR